ncbi:unnamed protein product, partial [Iphiclides podalirius]
MNFLCQLVFFLLCINVVVLQGPGSGQNGNLRLCIVEGRGPYKRGAKYCPVLDEENSGIECVLGTDRLDCLRRISKGTVDFGVFSPEDLVAAQWASVDVLVTDEIRHRDREFERSVVAVVNKRILPDSAAPLSSILRNSSLCHPGVGVDDLRPLSDTLAGYLESLVISRSCEPDLSLSENRIKAVADFFGRACKAGPWVPDGARDAQLKAKYPSLCAACRTTCSKSDRYWGDGGALACLAEGAGDVMWSELDDVIAYFQLKVAPTAGSLSTDHLAYLCRDGTWQPLANNTQPCVWLNRPWPVVVAKRKAAAAVSALVSTISSNAAAVDPHWRGALAALLELRAAPKALRPSRVPLDHLATARGFREAYSQSGCDPPRHITVCTKSLLEKNKCEWLSEAGAVYGITPPVQCTIRESERDCMDSVRKGDSDVVIADSDWLVAGMRDYSLTAVLHEATPIVEKAGTVVAYARRGAMLEKMADLRGKRAAFPRFDGLAWHSVARYLADRLGVPCDRFVGFFGEVCAPGIVGSDAPQETVELLTKGCLKGGAGSSDELTALRSLVEGRSDVAFLSMKTFNKYKANIIHEPWAQAGVEIAPICPEENKKYCFISWSNLGHIFASSNSSHMRRQEIINVFTKLDQLFGKHQPFHNAMFSMYGAFNHKMDVLFHNNTKGLATDAMLNMYPYDKIPLSFERALSNVKNDACQTADLVFSSSFSAAPIFLIYVASLVLYDRLEACIESAKELDKIFAPFKNDTNVLQSSNVDSISSNVNKKKGTIKPAASKADDKENSKTSALSKKKVINQNPNMSLLSAASSSKHNKTNEKRNNKGETALHVACRLCKIDKVVELLNEGANPNTKDNAGWTPLHEVVQNGRLDLVKILLQHNTLVNVPGQGNETPLHEAVRYNHRDIVEELVRHGADLHARNSKGETPTELASTEIKRILETAAENLLQTQGANVTHISHLQTELDFEDIRIYCVSQYRTVHNKLKSLVKHHSNLHIEAKFTKKVTHLIVDTEDEGICTPSLDVLQGIVYGIWILSSQWVTESNEDILQQFNTYEVKGVGTTKFKGPENARFNKYKQLPGLFNGCHFYLHNFNTKYEISKTIVLNKTILSKLITDAEGVVLRRVPNPESIPESEKLVPYHAKKGSKLEICSHYIIFKDMYEPMYNMRHFKALPIGWLMECIEKYELCEPE